MKKTTRQTITSIGIILAAVGLTYGLPKPTVEIAIAAGTEMEEPLKVLTAEFQKERPDIRIQLKFQGSQELVNDYLQKKGSPPQILIPASAELLDKVEGERQAIAKTLLVGVVWQESASALFPDGEWNWSRLEAALKAPNWQNKGKFVLAFTDPKRSNSGRMTIDLWSRSTTLDKSALFKLIPADVERPRSTDILLQEFAATKDSNAAIAYESSAIYRFSQAEVGQKMPYQIYYPNPTLQTEITAVVLPGEGKLMKASQNFIDFLKADKQQKIIAKYGFRPTSDRNLDREWGQGIPGIKVDPQVQTSANSLEIDKLIEGWGKSAK
jgi:ABC-type molybdate transport system substrate-binding protein